MMLLWKDVGETTRGHVMGRRKRSNWDHSTHGLGKDETLEHKLVVVSTKGSVTRIAVPQSQGQ